MKQHIIDLAIELIAVQAVIKESILNSTTSFDELGNLVRAEDLLTHRLAWAVVAEVKHQSEESAK